MASTFAGGSDVTDTFKPFDGTYPTISVNGTLNGAAGSKLAVSNNTAILTANVTVQPALLTGQAPGIAAVAYLTATGAGRNVNYQIYDPNGIAGYRVPGGKMSADKPGGAPVLINLMLSIDVNNNGSITEKSLTDWNNANPNNKIVWSSMHSDVASVDQNTGYFTAEANGAAVLMGSVTDKWGTKQSIPVLVTVGTGGLNVIDAGDGTYWLPGDAPNTYYETDQDGNIKVPPHIIYNPNGPGSGTDNVDLYLGDDGNLYVPDSNYPNIWHQFDPNAGKVMNGGKTIWGGPDGAPGGGDDKNAVFNPNNSTYYVDLGQNVFQKVDRTGVYAGQSSNNPPIGGGADSTPGTNDDLQNIFMGNDGKYYSGPYTDGQTTFYIGDKPVNDGGNGKLDTSGNGFGGYANPIADSDTKWYLDSNGNLVPQQPSQTATVTDVTITPGPTLDMSGGTFTQFIALVTGTNNPPQTVTWQIYGNQSPGTIIDNNGMFTLASDEKANTVNITATSLLDPSQSDTVTVFVRPSVARMYTANNDKINAGNTSIIIKDDGSMWAAGYNNKGQMGQGDTKSRSTWTPVMPGTTFQAVSQYDFGSDSHVLAITSAGKLYGWGNNQYGQVGDGTKTMRTTPVWILPSLTFKAVATGCHFSMALTTDGKVYVWGCNPYGELGDGSTSTSATPALNTTLSSLSSPVKSICAGEHFSAAITEAGKLYMWGLNNYGQLGDSTTTKRTIPYNIMPEQNFRSVSCSSEGHTLALTTDGRLYSWGLNNNGQLGDGSKSNRKTPMQITDGIESIRTGDYYSMALRSDGRLYTWGSNNYGQLGVGSKSSLTVPTWVTPGITYKAIAAGENSSMAITNDGFLYVWGSNVYGQYGNGMSGSGSVQSKTIPTYVPLS